MATKLAPLDFDVLRENGAKRCVLDYRVKQDDWTPADWMLALIGEVGELANFLKKVHRGDFTLESVRREVEDEIADIQGYLDLLAWKLDIDLGAVTVRKFNEVSDRIRSPIKIRLQPAIEGRPIFQVVSEEAKTAFENLISTACEAADESEGAAACNALVSFGLQHEARVSELEDENKKLRRLVHGRNWKPSDYTDDGEMQSGQGLDSIDYKRDPVDHIIERLSARADKEVQLMAPEAKTVVEQAKEIDRLRMALNFIKGQTPWSKETAKEMIAQATSALEKKFTLYGSTSFIEDNEKYKAALRFYAEEKNYRAIDPDDIENNPLDALCIPTTIQREEANEVPLADCGEIARLTLAGKEWSAIQ